MKIQDDLVGHLMSTNEYTVLYAKVTTRPPVIRRLLLYRAAPTVLSYTQSSATFLAFTHWNYSYYQHPFSYDIPSFNCLNFYWKKKKRWRRLLLLLHRTVYLIFQNLSFCPTNRFPKLKQRFEHFLFSLFLS